MNNFTIYFQTLSAFESFLSSQLLVTKFQILSYLKWQAVLKTNYCQRGQDQPSVRQEAQAADHKTMSKKILLAEEIQFKWKDVKHVVRMM